MSKTTENILLLPGENGWEIWSGTAATGFTLTEATTVDRPGDITSIPAGDVTLFFPVKAVTAIPMRATSEDESLFGDLATLHAERLGLKPDPMAGQLSDTFVVSRGEEGTILLSVILRSLEEGDLPTRGPKEFEVSARALPATGDSLIIWKELGRWVFGFTKGGNLAYCQATSISSATPTDELVREIRIAFNQLLFQEIKIEPAHIFLWSTGDGAGASTLSAAFGKKVEILPRPAPMLPAVHSKLLPADVRAARKAAVKRRNILMAAGAAALVYLGGVGWLGYGMWKESSETKKLTAQAEAAAPDGQAFAIHQQKWDELSLIQIENSPVDILSRVARCIPMNVGLRLRTADISAAEVKLIGEAPQPGPVNDFSKKLSQSTDLLNFKWQTPPPNQSNRGWEFSYTGTGQ